MAAVKHVKCMYLGKQQTNYVITARFDLCINAFICDSVYGICQFDAIVTSYGIL